MIRLTVLAPRGDSGCKANEVEVNLCFRDKLGQARYCDDLPDEKTVTAAATLAGIFSIRLLSMAPMTSQLFCSVGDAADDIQLGIFLVYLSTYTKQMQYK